MNALVLASFFIMALGQKSEDVKITPAVLLAGPGFFGQRSSGNLQDNANVDDVSDPNALKNNEEVSANVQDEGLAFIAGTQHRDTVGVIIDGLLEPLNLPAGATLLLGPVDTSFHCGDSPYGYFADLRNYCRVFHVCLPFLFEDGHIEPVQYSFMCEENSVYDQKEMTCVERLAAIPCEESPNYYYRNEEFGLPQERF